MFNQNLYKAFFTCLLSLAFSCRLFSQQVADTAYHYKISDPFYKSGKGPLILFDAGHGNPFSLKNVFSGFNKLLSEDGYTLAPATSVVNKDMLSEAKIYVSINAISDPSNWSLPTSSAFTSDEIKTLNEWVKEGGSLFLITDYFPCSGSVHALAESFGFNLINGSAMPNDRKPEIFSIKKGNLLKSEITRTAGAAVDSIRIWGGAAFIPPASAVVLSKLDANYTVYLPTKREDIEGYIGESVPRMSGLGLANGAMLKYGKGRLVIFGDAAAFNAQVESIKALKRGFNHPDAHQNAQLLLNLVHWLDRGSVLRSGN